MVATLIVSEVSRDFMLLQNSSTRRCNTFTRKYNNMCGVRVLTSDNCESSKLQWWHPLFMLDSSSSYHFWNRCPEALLFLSARTIAMNNCPDMWSLRRLKSSLNKMRGFNEARLNRNSDVAITLMGCKLFCATQRNLHQVNVQVLPFCVDETLEVRQIVSR